MKNADIATSEKSEAVILYKSRHPKVSEWIAKFPDEMQTKLCKANVSLGAAAEMTIDECPNIGLMFNCYPNGTLKWLLNQLTIINTFPNVTNRLNDAQMLMLANDIIREHPDLNLAEICIFLGRLRRARYGEFYNSIDGTKIMAAMISFRKERFQEIEVYERNNAIKKKVEELAEWKRTATSFEEYKKTRERAMNGDEDALRQLGLTKDMLSRLGGADKIYGKDKTND